MSSLPAVDACPGLLVLHEARDGHVARIRLPGGYASAARWRALAGVADRFGDGRLDLTARGNIQLRGVRAAEGDALARAATAGGLLPSAAHDRARNIMASPLAGLGGRPPLRRLVRELDAALLGSPELAALPGRFLFAVDDGTGGSGLAGCDIGLLRRAGGHAELVVAGRLTGVLASADAATPIVAAAARAAVAAGVGRDVTRIADLADGGQAIAAAVGGTLGPAAQPVPDARLPLGALGATDAPGDGPAVAAAVGGLAAQPVPDAALTRGGPGAAVAPGVGRVLVAAARLGRLTSAQARLVAELLRRGEVARIAIAGRLVVPVSTDLAAARGRLADAGLLVSAADPLADVTACSGAACAKSAADVRAAARPLAGHPRTHWAGCARRCGCPPDAEPVIAVGADSYLLPGATQPVPLAALDGAPCPA
jgi:precorrin-3B synthase